MGYAERKLLVQMAKLMMSGEMTRERVIASGLKSLVSALTEPSDVFVYGTLRTNGTKDAKKQEMFYLDGYRLESVAVADHRFPIVVEEYGSSVVGNIRRVSPAELDDMDRYENCGVLYDRIAATVRSAEGSESRDVWVYVPLNEALVSKKNRIIKSGDWNRRYEDAPKLNLTPDKLIDARKFRQDGAESA